MLLYRNAVYVFPAPNTTQEMILCDTPFKRIHSLPQKSLNPKESQNTVFQKSLRREDSFDILW